MQETEHVLPLLSTLDSGHLLMSVYINILKSECWDNWKLCLEEYAF